MSIVDFFAQTLFTLGDYNFTVANLGAILAILLGSLLFYSYIIRAIRNRFFSYSDLDPERELVIARSVKYITLIASVFFAILSLGIDLIEILNLSFFSIGEYEPSILQLIYVFLIIFSVRPTIILITTGLKRFYKRFEVITQKQGTINAFFKTIIRVVSVLLIFRALGVPFKSFLEYKLFTLYSYSFDVWNVVGFILIIFVAKILLWLLDEVGEAYVARKKIDVGIQFAVTQLIRYVIYVFAFMLMIDALGFNLTLIWGGAAALLVGFGLGLQQTFNDLVSGIILLFEGSVQVGDTLEVDGFIGTVEKIGIRTSGVRTMDNIMVIVPNSHLVVDAVINWSHNDDKKRFIVKVGTAYGSDTRLVKKLLMEVAGEHGLVMKNPEPFIRFVDFGDSSLNFELHFWSRRFATIENIKSDLRFAIDSAFRDHKVEIPFPQRDLWIRNNIQVGEKKPTPPTE